MSTNWNIQKKIVLVTGGTSGIGYEIARGLAARGATVIVVGRNASRGAAAIEHIWQQTGNTTATFIQADLSSLTEVRRPAEHITTYYPQLQILVNNAASQHIRREITVDGLEATFATTHLSPFLLTNLLLPVLETNAPARIVNINSFQHRLAQINLDDLQLAHGYTGTHAYSHAKLANLLTSYELARRLKGANVSVNVADPLGAPNTDLAKNGDQSRNRIWNIMMSLLSLILTPERAAKSSIYLASSPEAAHFTGKYVNYRCQVISSSSASHNEAMAKKVWQVSTELTGFEQRSVNYGV